MRASSWQSPNFFTLPSFKSFKIAKPDDLNTYSKLEPILSPEAYSLFSFRLVRKLDIKNSWMLPVGSAMIGQEGANTRLNMVSIKTALDMLVEYECLRRSLFSPYSLRISLNMDVCLLMLNVSSQVLEHLMPRLSMYSTSSLLICILSLSWNTPK